MTIQIEKSGKASYILFTETRFKDPYKNLWSRYDFTVEMTEDPQAHALEIMKDNRSMQAILLRACDGRVVQRFE
jgi:hypothetical protein